jgi:hypothetical protein
MSDLPMILRETALAEYTTLAPRETQMLGQARKLFDAGFPDHALLEIWNAAIHNLRRRVENYGAALFVSAVADESGRKKYKQDGESLAERWEGVDDLVLLNGAIRLGVLNKKAAKSLEMINWMRNHASPAHDGDARVETEDVVGLALILQKSLFEHPLPDPGHSPSGLFEPVRGEKLDEERLTLLRDQIKAYRKSDRRITFGFLLDLLVEGKEPALSNAVALFATAWELADEELKSTAGAKYHSLRMNAKETAAGSDLRLLEVLIAVAGVRYIPDGARAVLYRRVAADLSGAKDKPYGWAHEAAAAKGLAQLGPHVPSQAFEDVYQEILSVWCGNYWGHSSGARPHLEPFIEVLDTRGILRLCRLFESNDRAKEELFQAKPRAEAVALVRDLKKRLSVQAHVTELEGIIKKLKS